MELDLIVAGAVFFEVFIPERPWPPLGSEALVERIPVGLGGALNTASVARGLGLEVALVSPRGRGLTDRAIASELERLGIRAVTWAGADDGAITLVRSLPEDRAFITAVDRGALARCPALPRARFVHVGGLAEAEAFADRLLEARASGAKISVSAGDDPPRLARLRERAGPPLWDLFFLNADEARALGVSGPAELAGRLARDVVLTRGPDGAEASFEGALFRASARPVEVVDTTGAGDGFAAGVLAGLSRGLDPAGALALGAEAAARVLARRGGVLDAAELADLSSAR